MLLDTTLLDHLSAQAKASPRLRMNFDLRNTPEDKSQRMLNALEPGTVMPIHRHRNSSETVVVLRGRVKWTYYKDGSVSRGEDCGWIKDVITASSILDFTGTLNANGGVLADGTESNTVENLALVDLPTPTRPGYTFLGWFTAADGGDEVTIATAIWNGDAFTFY